MISRCAELLPDHHFGSSHEIGIEAAPDQIFDSLLAVDVGRSPLTRVLFALRGLPRPRPGLLSAKGIGFRTLLMDPPRTVVLGLIGQFWKARGNVQAFDAGTFGDFATPGFAKCVAGFEVAPKSEAGCVLRTETRVLCPDAASRRRFGLYWTVVGPFSGLIRTELLRLVKRDAEKDPRPGKAAQ